MKSRYWMLLILAIATVVRLIGFSSQSFTMDECLEIETAEMSVRAIIEDANSFPPLYHLLLKLWLAIEPSSLAVRTLSLLLGVTSVALMGQLVKSAVNEKAGLIAAALAAVSPFHVYYSQEGRAYILFLWVGVVATYFGLRILRGPSPWDRVGFVVAATLGGYTHYYFALLLVSIGVGIMAVKGLAYFAREVLPLATVIGICCIPLLLLARGDLDYQRDLRAPRPANIASLGYTVFSFESGYTLGASRNEIHAMKGGEAIRATMPWLAIVGLWMCVFVWLGCSEIYRSNESRFWACLAVIPIALVVVLCQMLGVTFNSRFLVCSWIPYCLVVASGLAVLPRKALGIVSVLLVTIYATSLYNRHHNPRYQNEDVRAVAEFLAKEAPRPILVCSGYMDQPLMHYSDGDIQRLHDDSCEGGSEEAALATLHAQQQPYWFVYTRPFHGDPDGRLLRAVEEDHRAQRIFEAAGVVVYDVDASGR